MIDFKDLDVFIKVAELFSFRKAADELHTTQPAVSARIKHLEDSLGIRLLERDRNRRQVALTPKGQEVLTHAKRLIRMRNEMIEAVNGSTERGTVRLGVAESIVHTWLPKLISRVSASYPELVLEIDVNISPELLKFLVAKELDLAFMVGPVNHPNLYTSPLCSFDMAFMAADPTPPAQAPMELEQIVTKPLVTFARNTKPHKDLEELLDREGIRATVHASASLEAVVQMALDGHAIAVIPPAVIENKPEARKRLFRRNVRAELPDLDFVVAWPDALVHPAAQRVAEIAVAVAAEARRSELA